MDPTGAKQINPLTGALANLVDQVHETRRNDAAPGVQSQTQATSLLSTQGQPEGSGTGAQLTSAPTVQAAATTDSDGRTATTEERDLARLKEHAEQGEAQVQFDLGMAFLKGVPAKEDRAQAFEYISKAAEQGHAEAQSELGLMYYLGESVESDDAQAFYWFSKAAAKGFAEAQRYVGYMYLKGEHVKKNPEQAFDWLSKAAQQGNEPAHESLSGMYRKGIYVRQDSEKAAQHLLYARGWGQPDVQVLNLMGCHVDDDMVTTIASLMQNDKAIEEMQLGVNSITDAGAATLARMLEQNTTLQELKLRSNPIDQPGLKAIADAMRSNTTLQKAVFTSPTDEDQEITLQRSEVEAQTADNNLIDNMSPEKKS